MNKIWFKKYRWIYYPISWQGHAITAVFLLFCINVFVSVDRNSHSVSDTLYGIFPFFSSAFLLWLWAASNTSSNKS